MFLINVKIYVHRESSEERDIDKLTSRESFNGIWIGNQLRHKIQIISQIVRDIVARKRSINFYGTEG